MKRITYLVLLTAFLAFGFTSVLAADVQSAGEPAENSTPVVGKPATAAPVEVNWLSINGGGISYGSGGPLQVGYSIGQSVADREGSGGTVKVGIGFWYGSTLVCGAAKGDLNGLGGFSAADGVLMLNCVFLGSGVGTIGGDCNLCYTDVNCDGGLSASDAVLELNRVFVGLTAPPWCGL